MIKFGKGEVVGVDHTIRGMRNPKELKSKCDLDILNLNPNVPDEVTLRPREYAYDYKCSNCGHYMQRDYTYSYANTCPTITCEYCGKDKVERLF